MHTGTIKWFNADKGYGFIVDDSPNVADHFFHITALKPSYRPDPNGGEHVMFDIEEGRKGPQACNVELLNESEPAA